MEKHNRYYKNLNTEAVTIKYIDCDEANTKFEKKLARNEHIVECNKDGVILGSESKDVVQAYADITSLKKQLAESVQREIELNIEVDRLNRIINHQQQQTTDTEIKPIETTEDVVNTEVVTNVVNIETFDGVPVANSNDEVVKLGVKRKKRKTTKKKTTTKAK
jgi:regulator of replication initiation timing